MEKGLKKLRGKERGITLVTLPISRKCV